MTYLKLPLQSLVVFLLSVGINLALANLAIANPQIIEKITARTHRTLQPVNAPLPDLKPKLESSISSIQFPESITSDGRYYYISSGVAPNTAKSRRVHYSEPHTNKHKKVKQAKIAKFKRDGTLLDANFAPKNGSLQAVGGMVVIGHNIYVSDKHRLVAINAQTGKVRFSITFSAEGTQSLSGVTQKNNHELFIAASDTHQIFIVNLEKKTYSALRLNQKLYAPKGLIYDQQNQTLFVTEFGTQKNKGRLLKIKPQPSMISPVEVISGSKQLSGHLDAISKVGHSLFFSDWSKSTQSGKIRQYNLQKKTLSTLQISRALRSPSDLFLDKAGRWWIPSTLDHFVLITPAATLANVQ